MFAVCLLSGPGRLSVIDGEVRYEAARGLVDHGSEAITDPEIRWNVFPGRSGSRFTRYRFPQIGAGVVAIGVADALGGGEPLRRFTFAAMGSVAASALSVVYLLWFHARGLGLRAATGYAAAGVFCLPTWYFATDVFDENLAPLCVVAGIAAGARAAAVGGAWTWLSAALWATAFNLKQPLVLFAVVPGSLLAFSAVHRRQATARASLQLAGIVAGVAPMSRSAAGAFHPRSPRRTPRSTRSCSKRGRGTLLATCWH